MENYILILQRFIFSTNNNIKDPSLHYTIDVQCQEVSPNNPEKQAKFVCVSIYRGMKIIIRMRRDSVALKDSFFEMQNEVSQSILFKLVQTGLIVSEI